MTNPDAQLSHIAIGRQIDPAWVAEAGDRLCQAIPSDIELRLQRTSGVVYANAARLVVSGAIEDTAVSQDERQTHVAAYTESLVAALCDRGELDPQTAYSGISLPLKPTGSIGLGRGEPIRRIFVNLEDMPDPSRRGAYMVRTEKHMVEARATYSRLGGLLVPKQRIPKYQVSVGEIYGQVQGRGIGRLIKTALKDLGRDVPLLPIGTLRLDTRESLVTLATPQDELDEGLVETINKLLDERDSATTGQIVWTHFNRELNPDEMRAFKAEMARVLEAGIAVRGRAGIYIRPAGITDSAPVQPAPNQAENLVKRQPGRWQTAEELTEMIVEGLGGDLGATGKPKQRGRQMKKRK